MRNIKLSSVSFTISKAAKVPKAPLTAPSGAPTDVVDPNDPKDMDQCCDDHAPTSPVMKGMSHVEAYGVRKLCKAAKGEHYPFSQCLIDRQKDGYSQESASKICGAIKAGTVVHKNEFIVTPNEDGSVNWALNVEFTKVDAEERIVKGVVYEPDVVDSQGDSASADEIRKACHGFMADSKTLGVMHKETAGPRASIVENYITDNDQRIGNQSVKKGTWMMAAKVHDDKLWNAIKKGDITGFSMGGRAESAD